MQRNLFDFGSPVTKIVETPVAGFKPHYYCVVCNTKLDHIKKLNVACNPKINELEPHSWMEIVYDKV